MRKVNVLEFVSLDGVIQGPGGPEEDTSGGFAYGGWTSPHSDPVVSTAIRKPMNLPFDLLLVTSHEWQPSVFLNGDIAEKSPKLSDRKGRICTFMEAQIWFRRSSIMIWSMRSG